jgi:hypothetical protein
MIKSKLLLNSFPATLVPSEFDLPSLVFNNWEDSTQGLSAEYGAFSWYRTQEGDRIRAVLMNGPEVPDLQTTHINAGVFPDFGKAIIARSMSRYFATRGFEVERANFGTTVLRRAPEGSQGFIDTFCGIAFQVRHPFESEPGAFSVSAQWEVNPRFNQSLAEPQLSSISRGMGVIYRPQARVAQTDPLKKYLNKYVGHVIDCAQTTATIECRDHINRKVPLSDLFLEASPAVIRVYERRSGVSHSSRSLWYRLQELSFVLNKQGRRNTSVLKDRLQAIRAFLGGSTKEQLIIPLDSFAEGTVNVSLSPARAEVA